MRTRKLFYRRAFLNKPRHESIGLILAEAKIDGNELEAKLTVGDCTRQIVLDFSLWVGAGEYRKVRHDEIANLRHKSAVLRKTVGDFLDAVEVVLVEIEASDA